MLKGAIICPDEDLAVKLEELLSDLGVVAIVRTLPRYPNAAELQRMLRATAPQVLFLSVESLARAMEIVNAAEIEIPGVQIVAIGRNPDPQTLIEVMRSGIREFVSLPFNRQLVYEGMLRLKEVLDRRPAQMETTDHIFSFLPAKPGVGSTTIATNIAAAIARLPQQKTLLVDCDLNSGMVRFLMQIENQFSILDAAERAFQMDENMWPQLVSSHGNLDVLHSGQLSPERRVEPAHIRHIIDFARRTYKSVILDLSGNMEKYAIEAMHESKRVFLVVTSEVASLHLAREKLAYLRSLDLSDKVSLILNRCQKRALISPQQVQELLSTPLTMSFANDYQGVYKATTAGKPVEVNSDLGKQFTQLAHMMVDRKPPQQQQSDPPAKRKFVEFFSINPTGSLLGGKKAG